ncbi:hypothetical protein AURDEDRAFT_128386 [Auricularia subglabra TFB-10046 SS5]|nr:hypothetical protein AURDEDRAFT_128386 [Auricularia subglabra TFB-10046 SS5]
MDDREARRSALECDFARHEARHTLLSEKLKQARARRAEVLAALEAADDTISRLAARCDEVGRECAVIRHLIEFDPTMVNRLPIELLRAIWSELRASIAPQIPWTNSYDAKRRSEPLLLLPGRLAAVCRHWRTVALNTPELWTDIALPPMYMTARGHELFLEYVKLQLERSRPRALDIMLIHASPASAHCLAFQCFEKVLWLVCEHAARWRRATFWFPNGLRVGSLDDQLAGCSLPVLEELRVSSDSSGQPWFIGSWISTAQSLTSISIHGVPLSPSPSLCLNAVVIAHLHLAAWFLDIFWDSLPAFESVQSLSLMALGELRVAPPSTKITLLKLETLKLRGQFRLYETLLAPALSAPRLKRLNIEVGAIEQDAGWGRAFFAAFPSIVELDLTGDGNQVVTHERLPACFAKPRNSRLTALSRLKSLKSVTFHHCPFYGQRLAQVSNTLLIALNVGGDTGWRHEGRPCTRTCPPPSLVWPELESMTVCGTHVSEANETLLTDFACFVRTRAEACAARGKQFKFALLDWPSQLPSWFHEALACVLGPAHVRLTTVGAGYRAPLEHDGTDEDEPGEECADSAESSDSDASSPIGESEWEEGCSSDSGEEWLPDSDTV